MLTVVIGTQPAQYVAQRVLEYSIAKSASSEVDVRPMRQTRRAIGGTQFGFVRFGVPHACGFRGRGIYLDADQVMLGDVHELAAQLEAPHAIGIVRDIEGTFDGKPVAPRNETSMMVLDCEKLGDWNPDTMFDKVVPNDAPLAAGQIHYKDFMRLAWVDPETIQSIDPRWNHYNVVRDDTKLIHYSHVRAQPWKRPEHAYADFWAGWLSDAIGAGYVRRLDILKAVARGHLHRHYLRYAV